MSRGNDQFKEKILSQVCPFANQVCSPQLKLLDDKHRLLFDIMYAEWNNCSGRSGGMGATGPGKCRQIVKP